MRWSQSSKITSVYFDSSPQSPKKRHRVGTYSGDTMHLPNQNMYIQNKLGHKHVPGISIHFTFTLLGILHACVPGHAASIKSQLTQTIKHSSGNKSQVLVAAVNFCSVHMRRAVAGACCIRGARQGQHQTAYIHLRLHLLHVPGK